MNDPRVLDYATAGPRPSVLGALLKRKEAGIFIALLALTLLITAWQPHFARWGNIYTVSRQIAYTAIVALGVFFVILTGGIDLSVGSVVSLSGVAGAWLMTSCGIPPALAVCGGLLCGTLLGLINGVIVAYVGVTSFIVTLGMLGMARGVVLVATHGDSIRNIPDSFINAGLMDVLIFPMAVVVLAIVAITSHVVLTYTPFGRRVYAVGGNEAATALSGINTRLVKLAAFGISGLFSAVTGMLFVSKFSSAQANSGLGIEMDAIAAAVIGGTSLMGGEGTVVGVLIGATIMGVIRNGLVLMEVSSYWQELIIGSIIVLAAVIDVVRNRRR